MNGARIFWAQAIDNASPDHLEVQGASLAPSEKSQRERAVSDVSRVASLGRRVFDSKHVQLTIYKDKFVLRVPSLQRDQAGRIAPIVCCGDFPPADLEDVGEVVISALTRFAQSIGRSIEPEYIDHVRQAFASRKKKRSAERILAPAAWALLAIFVLLVLLWWASSGSS